VARDAAARIQSAADPVLVDGERITGFGQCWGAQVRGKVPLLLRARRQYLMALTDRRLLLFERKRRPAPRDLVLGKRYETFTIERVRRRRPLLQILVNSANGTRMAFEFRPGQRDVGGELIARLTPKNGRAPTVADPPAPGVVPVAASEPPPPPVDDTTAEHDPDANVILAARLGLGPEPERAPDPEPSADPERDESDAFWNRK
jgi:hypothetical protein